MGDSRLAAGASCLVFTAAEKRRGQAGYLEDGWDEMEASLGWRSAQLRSKINPATLFLPP